MPKGLPPTRSIASKAIFAQMELFEDEPWAEDFEWCDDPNQEAAYGNWLWKNIGK